MIFVRDKGRLCNNILQYGHLYAWGREHGRKTMSMRFAYKYQYFRICHTPWHNFLTYSIAKYTASWGMLPVVRFDDPDADYSAEENMLLKHKNIVAQGWYARWYDLFLKYKDEILDLFQFDEKVKEKSNALLQGIPSNHVRLGLHIRRGDYRTFHDGIYYYSDEQYVQFIQQFLALHQQEPVSLFICGNYAEIDEAVFRDAFPNLSITFPKGNPGQDLYLLSQCDWLMGPPSTFTLVASMYRDTPLCWIESADATLSEASFNHFDHLFRNIK